MKKKFIAPLAIVGSLALALLGGTAAYADDAPALNVTPDEASPGEAVTISGADCYAPHDEVILTVDGNTLDPVAGTDDGKWSVKIDAPSMAGEVLVEARCESDNVDQDPFFEYVPASFTALGYPAWAEIGEITRDECVVSIPVWSGPGSFTLHVWDDRELVEEFTWDSENYENEHIVKWIITQPSGGNPPGVTFTVSDNAADGVLDYYGPYEYPDEVAQQCAPKDDPAPAETPTPPKKVETAAPGSTQAGVPGLAGLLVLATLGAAVSLLRRNVTQQ